MNDKNKKKPMSKWLKALIAIAVIAVLITSVIIYDMISVASERELEVEEAQNIVNESILSLPKVATVLIDATAVKVNEVEKGASREFILKCTYETKDIGSVIEENSDELFYAVYAYYLDRESSGTKTSGTNVRMKVASPMIKEAYSEAEIIKGDIDIHVYQLNDGTMQLYLSNEVVNTCYGGVLDALKLISDTTEIIYNDEIVDITNLNTLRTGISDCFALKNYDPSLPNTGTALMRWWDDIEDEFYRNFIQNDNWKHLANGLLTTLKITFFALLIGVVIGFLVAIIRVTYSKTKKLKIADSICRIYVSIIRGTPVMVQLLIIYFVMLLPLRQIMLEWSADIAAGGNMFLSKIVAFFAIDKFGAAVLCFGLNSGAYVAEIVRGGIMSVDNGQTEAGRSLGFTYAQTMIHIVIPQAFKAVLPALANEFITLLKESSVAFYIGVGDLTKGGITIRSVTYSNFMPLIAVAVIYLVVVLGLTYLVSLLEKRLQKGDR